MDKILLEQIILRQNKDIFGKDIGIQREKLEDCKKHISYSSATIISGIRRCGKSTLLNQIMSHIGHDKCYYCNFDDEGFVNFNAGEFHNLEEILYKNFGKRKYFFFDEVQNIDKWELFVRRLVDEGKKVFVTGSNASLLSRELGTRLTGRHSDIILYPFSFEEFLTFYKVKREKHDTYLIENRAVFKKNFDRYLEFGGMPGFLKTLSMDELKNIYDDIIYRDIVSRYSIEDEKSLRELSFYLISNISTLFTYNSLTKVLNNIESPHTIKKYIGYLENSYLFFTLPRYEYKYKKQINSPKKIYSIDTGMTNAIAFRFSENKGGLLENLVYLDLRKKYSQIFYYKTSNNLEVDFLVKEKERVKEIMQVAWDINDQKTFKRETDALLKAMDELKLKKATIITYDEEKEVKQGNKIIQIIPVWKWLLSKN